MTTRTDYIQKMEAQIDEWKEEIAQLRSQVNHPAFQRHLDALSANVQAIHQKLHRLEQTPNDNWEVVRVDVEDGVVILHQNFNRTRKEFNDGAYGWDPEKAQTHEVDSEGWVEGMGHREHDSEGWVEGMGHQEKDSEGWVEGMGHQEKDSEGWSEGTDKQ